MIVVFGATGPVGRAVVAQLTDHGIGVRAVSRDPVAARQRLPVDADVVRADLRDRRSVRQALAGAATALVLSPHHPDQHRLQSALIDAARDAGVTRLVKLSGLDAAVRPESPSMVGRLHWSTEQHLRASGVPWAVVRPAPFMQNTLDWLDSAVRRGRLVLPMGRARIAMVDAGDVAAVLAAALVDPGHAGRSYVVTGPRALDLPEVADLLGRARGTRLRYLPGPFPVVAAAQRRQGVAPWLVEHQRAMAALLRAGHAAIPTDTVRAVTGRSARPFEEFAAAAFQHPATAPVR